MMERLLLPLALASTLSIYAAEPASTETPQPARTSASADKAYPWMGKIERLDPAVNDLLPPDAVIEKLAGGFKWSEGPVWSKRGGYLLFTDVPQNVVFKWQPGVGTREFLSPSGYTGTGEGQGANGLAFDQKGRLVLCQHGNRQVARLDNNGKLTPLVRHYNYRRLNSPNDLVFRSDGSFFFTDPPYGLAKGNNDPEKDLVHNGVYHVTPGGKVTLIVSNLTFPNGVALSPDEKTLYVAVSDPKNPVVMAYDLHSNGKASNGRVFFDAKKLAEAGGKGLPDGLKVDKKGNVWTTGPGGVLILSPEGKHLGTINTGQATANCAFGGRDGSVLYITAHMFLARVQTSVEGLGF